MQQVYSTYAHVIGCKNCAQQLLRVIPLPNFFLIIIFPNQPNNIPELEVAPYSNVPGCKPAVHDAS